MSDERKHILILGALIVLLATAGFATVFTGGLATKLAVAPRTQLSQVSSSLPSGLLAWWKLDDASGTSAADSGGNGHTATLQGTVLPSWASGIIGGALSFNGSDQATSDAVNFPSGNSFSISFWVNTTSGYSNVIGWTGNIFCLVSGQIQCTVTGNASGGATSAKSVNDGAWHHIVFTSTASAQALYVDGALSGQATQTLSGANGQVILGGRYFSTYNLSGSLDDVRIYDHSITSSDVAALYALGGSNTTTTTTTTTTSTTTTSTVSAPAISNVHAGSIMSSSAVITWNTDQLATSQTDYGLTTGYANSSGYDSTQVTSHAQTLTGLTVNTSYHYRVRSTNANGYSTSTDYQFTTTSGTVAANSSCPAPAGGKCWYVDNTAAGANNGTSWTDAWTSLKNVTGVGPGDIVYISGGQSGSSQTYYDVFNWHPIGGTSSAWVTYQVGQDGAHNGTVVFDGSRYDPNNPDTFAGITFGVNSNNVPISGDYVVLSGKVSVNGVSDGQQHLRIINYPGAALISNPDHFGLKIEYLDTTRPVDIAAIVTGVEISHSHFKPTAGSDHAMFIGGFRGTWGTNSIHDNLIEVGCTQNTQGEGDDGIQNGMAVDIYNNDIRSYYSATPGFQHQDGIQMAGQYSRIFNNRFENLANSAVYIDLFGGATAMRDIWIYNNLFQITIPAMADGYHRPIEVSFEVAQSNPATVLDDLKIFNNTIVDWSDYTGIGVSSRWGSPVVTNSLIKNNLFYNDGRAGQFGVITFGQYSPYDSTVFVAINGIDVSNNLAGAGLYGTTGMQDDTNPKYWTTPGFASYTPYSSTNNLHLASSDTIARGGGVNLSQYATIDADGVSRPSTGAWDIGAYQYSSNSSTPTNPPPPTTTTSNLLMEINFGSGFTTGTPSTSNYFPDVSGNGNNGLRYRVGTSSTDIQMNKGWPIPTTGPLPSLAGAQFRIYNDGWSPYNGTSGDYIGLPGTLSNGQPSNLNRLPQATISAWAHYDANSRIDSVIMDAGYYTQAGSWALGRNYSGQTQFIIANGTGGNMVPAISFPDATTCGAGHTTDNCDTGGWHLYTVTFDGTTFTGYFDGAPFANNTSTIQQLGVQTQAMALVSAGSYICISCGQHQGTPQWADDAYPNNGYMSGGIADLRIYGRALSPSEVGLVYAGAPVPDPSGTVPNPVTDTTPPAVSITAPTNTATVSGASVPISVTATDNVAISTVQLKVDGIDLPNGLLTTPTSGSTYSGTWDTTSTGNISHVITAIATDSSGNTTTSQPITVTVSNVQPTSSPTPTPTATPINPTPVATTTATTPTTPTTPSGGGGGTSTPPPVIASGGGGGGIGTFTPAVPQKPAITSTKPCVSTASAIPASALALTIGTRGVAVTNLQTFLVLQGYLAKQYITGYYGSLTSGALNTYLKNHPTSTCNNQDTRNNNQTNSNIPSFTRSLTIGATGTDVKYLQIFLNGHGFTVASVGNGSKGHETTYFGPATTKAVAAFQRAYSITPAYGYFGPLTRTKVNQLLNR